MTIQLGRDICSDLDAASFREWLVCNGKGGYASGTVSGQPTRGYHGLLVAALAPPLGRTLMLVGLAETASIAGRTYELSTLAWHDGTVAPQGWRLLESFRLEGAIPVWRFACGEALVEKRIWMDPGANTTRVQYRMLHGREPAQMSVKAFVDYRDYHSRSSAGQGQGAVEAQGDRVTFVAFPGATPLHLRVEGGTGTTQNEWYRGFALARERERGLQDTEDHLHAASFTFVLEPGRSVEFAASAEGVPDFASSAFEGRLAYEAALVERWAGANPERAAAAPAWVRQLVLAADQFVVARRSAAEAGGHSIIAGYPWFADWGRDTMIALHGLTLTTGRPEIARSILLTFAGFVDQGMLPNRFPDAGETPEYNTVDATLWFVEAVRRYHERTGDDDTLARLFPVLADIVSWHRKGTRYRIRMDEADGLLFAGEPGVQLTWMDARVGDREITPRIGKPVEVNALWYRALRFLSEAAGRLGLDGGDAYGRLADATQAGFERFWNAGTGYCYDVIDGPDGPDETLRPNQIIAVAVASELLDSDRRRAVVAACERSLLTSCGLRSLDPTHPDYRGTYGGDQASRDGAYHQGPVWGWLIGPFIEAWLKVGGDPEVARWRLDAFGDQVRNQGLGTVNEIFEGDAPMAPRGCIAQAWSVAEALRAWELVEDYAPGSGAGVPRE